MKKGILIGIAAVGVILFMLFMIWTFRQYLSSNAESFIVYCSEDQHQGLSTNDTCSSNNDCLISGCNGEICQSKSEELRDSLCLYKPPYPKDLECTCKCVDNKCMWIKIEV